MFLTPKSVTLRTQRMSMTQLLDLRLPWMARELLCRYLMPLGRGGGLGWKMDGWVMERMG